LIPYIYIIFIILPAVLLLTCSISYLMFLLWIYGTLNNNINTVDWSAGYTCVNHKCLPNLLNYFEIFTVYMYFQTWLQTTKQTSWVPGLTYMRYMVIARPHSVVFQLWRLGMI